MAYRYTRETDEKSAKAVGIALPISTKQAVEICNFIRGKNVDRAIKELNDVIDKKAAIPFKRFNRGGVGNKPGIGPGRYPEKACREILKIINSAVANAHVKGLSNLAIRSMSPQGASTTWHFGRKRRRKAKRTHIEIIVSEIEEKKSEEKKKETKKEGRGSGAKPQDGRKNKILQKKIPKPNKND